MRRALRTELLLQLLLVVAAAWAGSAAARPVRGPPHTRPLLRERGALAEADGRDPLCARSRVVPFPPARSVDDSSSTLVGLESRLRGLVELLGICAAPEMGQDPASWGLGLVDEDLDPGVSRVAGTSFS